VRRGEARLGERAIAGSTAALRARTGLAAAAGALALLVASAATPAGDGAAHEAARARAAALAAEGRCAAALEATAALRAAGAADAAGLALASACAAQLERYPEAAALAEEALALDPGRADARLRLAIARYHLGDTSGARAALDAAAAGGLGEDAELLLYEGLLLLEAERGAEAALALERARARDPRTVEPVASYYAGVAWGRDRDRARADAALARVVAEWPGTRWARQAERLRAELAAAELRRWARVRAGFEYDDNAILQGAGAPLPEEISSARDVRAAWSAEAGAELFRTQRWSGGALAAYAGTAYADITGFDSHFPSLAGWLDRRLDAATTLRASLDGGHAWVDRDGFFATGRASLALLRAWEARGTSELYARFRVDEYFAHSDDVPDGAGVPGAPCGPPGAPVPICGPPGLDERRERDRDGTAWVVGARHAIAVARLRSTFRAGWEFERFDARGREYSFRAHSLSAGVLVALPGDLALDASGVVTWRPFDHPSTFPEPPAPVFDREYGLSGDERDERYQAVSVSLARPIGWGLTASAGWRWERNRSNVDVFDYRREVLGAYLTWAWGH
jgi:tetratricopeptide (TPR) repeat protein